MAVINLTASNILVLQGFAQAAFPAGRHLENVAQALTLQQAVVVRSTNQRPSNTFTISQAVKVNKVVHLSTQNFLPMYSQGAKTRFLAISNLLRFTQSATRDKPAIASNTLNFTQTVNVHKGLLNRLVFTQSAFCNVRRNLSASNQLVIVEATVGYIDGNWQFVAVAEPPLITNYDPSNLAIPPVPATPFPVVFVGNRNSLQFTNVEFGDIDRIEHTRISRRTQGEELIIFRDSRWPRTETLKFKLTDITAAQGKAMLNFMEDNLAQVIKFSDWLGVRWLGVITNPDTMVMQPVRDQNCSGRYDLEIEFQGVQLGYTVNLSVADTLDLSQGVVKV